MSDFDESERVLSIPPDFNPEEIQKFCHYSTDGSETKFTFIEFWDDTDHTKKRAGVFGVTFKPLKKKDGGWLFSGFFTKSLLAALGNDPVLTSASEISKEQYQIEKSIESEKDMEVDKP